MPLAALVCAGLLGMVDAPPDSRDRVATEYQEVEAAAGRSPAAQIRLALWCEAHGLTAERARHLALALLADPTNATARGLAGLVARDGRWVAPDAVARNVGADAAAQALLTEYDLRRSKTPYTADAQWELAQWADEHGLKDQARAHFTAVTRLDPGREVAWKRLGYRKHDGRWETDAQRAAARAEADAQKQADRTWTTQLERWKGMLGKPDQHEAARVALLGVTDPRAVPAIARVFGTDRLADQQAAVTLLGQITAPRASRALAALAIGGATPDIRRVAVEILRQRDPRDFVGFWITLIRAPVEYKVQPVAGPGSPGALLIAGEKANTQRVYRPMDAPNLANLPPGMMQYDANGLPILVADLGTPFNSGRILNGEQFETLKQQTDQSSNAFRANLAKTHLAPGEIALLGQFLPDNAFRPEVVQKETKTFYNNNFRLRNEFAAIVETQIRIPLGQMVQQSQMSAAVAQQQLTRDAAQIDAFNADVRRGNEPILLALNTLTGENYGDDRARWDQWWTNEQGYAFAQSTPPQVPTYVENVPIGFTPAPTPIVTTNEVVGFAQVRRHSCFGAGTMVRTIAGTRRIEEVVPGDLMLVQDTHSGALSYQPVLTAFHNPPNSTFRITLGGETVVATGIHRFWKAGEGWAMARDLKVGDSIRVLGGVATVAAVTPEAVQPVFNLEVAEGGSFFVGTVGALVHDNSLVEATPNPFDAARSIPAADKP